MPWSCLLYTSILVGREFSGIDDGLGGHEHGVHVDTGAQAGDVDALSLIHIFDIPQPPGQTATNEEEAVEAARKIGFPVLVRPSYVLGGRAMEIVENEEDLRSYMRTAVKADVYKRQVSMLS